MGRLPELMLEIGDWGIVKYPFGENNYSIRHYHRAKGCKPYTGTYGYGTYHNLNVPSGVCYDCKTPIPKNVLAYYYLLKL